VSTLWVNCEHTVSTLWAYCAKAVSTLWENCEHIVSTFSVTNATKNKIVILTYKVSSYLRSDFFFTCELPDDIKILKQNSDNSYHVGKCLTFVRMRHEKTSYRLGCLVSKRGLFLLTQVSCPIRFYLITGRRKQLWVRTVLRREKKT